MFIIVLFAEYDMLMSDIKIDAGANWAKTREKIEWKLDISQH